jgi:hypothetical protein
MSLISIRRLVLGCGVVLLTTAGGSMGLAPVTPESQEKAVSSAEKLRQALDQAITLDVNEQPLTATLNKIREQTKINFVIDRLVIQQMGYDPDQMPVSAKFKDSKAKNCLRSMLSPYNLSYAIIGDTVLISTDDMVIQRQMKQRVSIDLDKTDLATALKQLSRETATNLLLDSRVSGKDSKATVTLQLDDVPLETVIRLVAEAGGLKPVQVGNVMLVTTKALATEMRADPELMQGGVNPQQEIQMLQQKRMMMMQQGQLGGVIFQPVGGVAGIAAGAAAGGPAPPVEKAVEEKAADPKNPDPPVDADKKAPEKSSEDKKPEQKKAEDKPAPDKKSDKN